MTAWGCIEAAQQADRASRLPFHRATAAGECVLGSVPRAAVSVLLEQGPGWSADAHRLCLAADDAQASAVLAEANARLRALGWIRAWRDEPFALRDDEGRLHAVIERASARFWGSLTWGAHCNGYVADADGRPTHLWLARRADDKPTDPGRLDNLVGGGVPHGQTPFEALWREAWEEAGLTPADLAALSPGRVVELCRDVPEGLQRERLHVYDLCLPAGREPRNQDGEVAWHRCLPVAQALDHAARGDMTVDAALATLDFALRHDLLAGDEARALAARSAGLWSGRERVSVQKN